MAYLAKKIIKGKEYYYLMESKRIDGKPRHTKQIYLGSIEDVLEKLSSSSAFQPPLYTKDLELGNVAALYDLSKRLGLVDMINGIAGKRQQGLSLGEYLLAAIINRAVSPTSRTGLEGWYNTTMLSRWNPVGEGALSSQRFWDNASKWTVENMEQFEIEFLKNLVAEYHITPKCLIYDATNFFTYIDTENEKASLAQRGHCKAKRNDLRIVGLSLMFSREDEIPLFYEVYDGNRSDSKEFSQVIHKLKEKYHAVFGKDAQVTLVFDRGNNSEDNIGHLAATEGVIQYVGGLTKSQCADLYQIPKNKFTQAKEKALEGVTFYRTEQAVFGKMHTIVITDNLSLENGQLQGIRKNLAKCGQHLAEVKNNLEKRRTGEIKGGKKPTVESVTKKVEKHLSREYMKSLFQYKVWGNKGEVPFLEYAYSEDALEQLREHELGKTVLFTSHDDWSSEEIIMAYRSAWKIEHAFRQMKDPRHLTTRPLYCWTNHKIRVHIFCCIMALRMCCILKKELKEQGIETGINEMLECLGKKKQYIHYYQQKRGLKEGYSLSEANEKTEKMMEALDLDKYEIKS